ncbi:hypothetical protein [Mucilaginibacter pocheonensis]|uniref:Uncharacterized protein n=1 Tax=Mucilaginibacter pocheonensis TaxID=398050 RepID=A0ABU1TCK8_9SPHI|nr:hypothetical protein [Mucilaginibacter pocheonensis]MDR6943024.1 hypothetical protein [Mucilaginibacter pocheonensis]
MLAQPNLNLMQTLTFILLQSTGAPEIITILIVFGIAIVIFLVIRSLMLWYWKVDVVLNNQEAQTSLLQKQNNLIQEQNELLKLFIANRLAKETAGSNDEALPT